MTSPIVGESVKVVADELGIDPGRLSKWRQKDCSPVRPTEGLADEQREIKRLQKELKEAQLERDMDLMLTQRLLV
ncbi:transposase [Pontibacter diazotrophicus]|uniref:transposase n=1 Tax=Pontibacter diazotrophicus TaxID=1400979 RepID=UPI0015F15EFB|nr:transposase [Pontibacter diazotrophicus]